MKKKRSIGGARRWEYVERLVERSKKCNRRNNKGRWYKLYNQAKKETLITDAILLLMDKKRKIQNRNSSEYKNINKKNNEKISGRWVSIVREKMRAYKKIRKRENRAHQMHYKVKLIMKLPKNKKKKRKGIT